MKLLEREPTDFTAIVAGAKVEPLHQRALAIREKELGPAHLEVAKSLNHLAILEEKTRNGI